MWRMGETKHESEFETNTALLHAGACFLNFAENKNFVAKGDSI
jgi:hypothetical protein